MSAPFARLLSATAPLSAPLAALDAPALWANADDLVRRVTSTVEVQGTSSTTTVTYTDYGQEVDVQAPPAAQVTDQVPGLGG